MDKNLAARILSEGRLIEENTEDMRIWPSTIDGRWLYPGECVIEFEDQRYVVVMPKLATPKNIRP